MPLSITAVLWGVNEGAAAGIARKLAAQSLVKRTETKGEQEASISLLDLHLQYLRQRGRNSLADWHARLLDDGCPAEVPARSGYWEEWQNFLHHLTN